MKCRNSAFNTQCSRVIIVVVQVGAVKYICSTRFENNYRNCICSTRFESNYRNCTGRTGKIYVVAVEALRKKERQDETQFTTKTGGKSSFGPSYFLL
jgi:hypothetical protein